VIKLANRSAWAAVPHPTFSIFYNCLIHLPFKFSHQISNGDLFVALSVYQIENGIATKWRMEWLSR